MYAVVTFIIVAVISMLFTRVATGALIATGLPPDVARFQARSAFTGTGFTTTESENVVNHPARRKVLSITMLVGNLGTPTLIVAVLAGLIGPGPGDTVQRLVVMVAVLAVALVMLSLRPVTDALVRVGANYARNRLLPAVGSEPIELLDLGDEFVVADVRLKSRPHMGPRSLGGLDLALPGVKLLGVRRGSGSPDEGHFIGEPPRDLDLGPDDVLVVYGSRLLVDELADVEDPRPA